MGSSRPVALIVGATSGIGEAVAHRAAAEGMAVVLNSGNSPERGAELAAELPVATYVQAAMGRREEADRLVAAALEAYGRLDLVVYSAAKTEWIPHADVDAVTEETWRDVLDVNLLGAWWLIRAAREALGRSGSGSCVLIGSLAGTQAGGSSVPYAISKAALHHLARVMAPALGPEIRVNVVAPGFIDTPWTKGARELREAMAERMPLRRAGQPQEVAELVLGLHRSTYVTGQIVLADGGFSVIP